MIGSGNGVGGNVGPVASFLSFSPSPSLALLSYHGSIFSPILISSERRRGGKVMDKFSVCYCVNGGQSIFCYACRPSSPKSGRGICRPPSRLPAFDLSKIERGGEQKSFCTWGLFHAHTYRTHIPKTSALASKSFPSFLHCKMLSLSTHTAARKDKISRMVGALFLAVVLGVAETDFPHPPFSVCQRRRGQGERVFLPRRIGQRRSGRIFAE